MRDVQWWGHASDVLFFSQTSFLFRAGWERGRGREEKEKEKAFKTATCLLVTVLLF